MNAGAGVKVEKNADPELLENQINNGNGVGLHLQPGAKGRYVGNDIAANYGDQLRIEGNKLGSGDLYFENNRVDWSFQPSFKHPDLAPIIRQQGNKAFLEAPETPTAECLPPPPPPCWT
mmetsp:Transcript_47558/g.148940  ORF Transcript_47558/g.148940 Transcript_47558/m.148940 type:complete len:119 (+) Transcript_47558:2282-2638(+)